MQNKKIYGCQPILLQHNFKCGFLNMRNIIDSIPQLIGNTPLYKFPDIPVYGKAEFFNPGGSIKDRIALAMINAAEEDGILLPESILVEPTSGNTGIGIALVGRFKGYNVRIVMPENMSSERRKLIAALGAEIILTPAKENVQGAIDCAFEMQKRDSRVCILNQFCNPVNPLAHYITTAPEIWNDMDGDIACFISGIGSGGTIQGIGKFLKNQNADIKIIAVEPKNISALLGHEPGLHQIQGIGDGFIPEILDVSLIDDIVEVNDDDAISMTKYMNRKYGLLVGISSGANFYASRLMSKKIKGNIVTILPDRAERYFSTSLMNYSDVNIEFMTGNIH
jgi:cysteine synthase A